MEILYDNHVFDSTISASSENPFYTFDDALNDNALARVGRTAGDTSQWILFDATAAVSVDFFYIQSHNITSGATIKIQANATDSWGSPTIDQTVTWSSGYMLYEWGSTQSYRYWRFSVSDASNTDDYIELSYVFLGQALSMPGMELSQDFGRNTTSTATFSNSGQLYGNNGHDFDDIVISFPVTTNAQKTSIITFLDTVKITRPLVLFVWQDSLSTYAPLYSSIVELPRFVRRQTLGGLLYTFQLKVQECK